MSWSPDGKRILTGSGQSVKPGEAKGWDAEKGQELLTLKGHTRAVNSVSWSPDGKKAFAWDSTDKVLAWTVEDGKPIDADKPLARTAPGSARSPDGRLAAKPDRSIAKLVDLLQPPSDSWPLPDAAERKAYHGKQAALAETEKQWFAVAFHLGRLLLDYPDNAALRSRRDEALQRHVGREVAPPLREKK